MEGSATVATEVAREGLVVTGEVFEPVTAIGGDGGDAFDYYGGTNGKLLERIKVWAGGWQIKAIEVKLTGEDARTFGDPGGCPSREFSFDPGERIVELSLWGNGAGTRLGWIRFKTNRDRVFDFGMTDWGRKTEYPVTQLGDGLCCGVLGGRGSDIDRLGFVFLTPVRTIRMKDVRYPTLSFDSEGIAPVRLDSYRHTNNSGVPYGWSFQGQREEQESVSWSVGAGVKAYGEVTVQAGVPEVAEVGEKFGWEVTATATYSTTNTHTDILTWSDGGTLNPGDSISLEAVTRRGQLRIPYTGVMEVQLESGPTFSWEVSGDYEGLSYSGVEITGH